MGLDLVQALSEKGHHAKLLTKSAGFDWRDDISMLLDADFVWIAAGFGSVEAALRDPSGAFDCHVAMPVKIAMGLPETTRIVCFSSDYAADESTPWSPGALNRTPRSLYAVTKISMELALKSLKRPNTFAVRVCSLYGEHYPERTFPGRLLKRFPTPADIEVPMNRTTPTPTKWVADVLARHLQDLTGDFRVHHVAPGGTASIVQWAKKILGNGYKIESKGLDQSRPLCSNLRCTFENVPDWEELWNLHWLYQKYHAKAPLDPPTQVT